MTDISKYKSLAVDHACYNKIDQMTKLLAPGHIIKSTSNKNVSR